MIKSVTFHGLIIFLLLTTFSILPAYSVDVTVGLLAGSNDLGEVEEAAYNWADDNYPATILVAGNGGTFESIGGGADKLDQYAVLWLFYTETNQLPGPFGADATKKAILDYVESGGGLFLSALGLRYVMDMGVDDGGNARVFQPLGKGPPEIGVMPTEEAKNHPVFKGFDTAKPIFLTSMDQAGFTADFINFKAKPPAGKILGTKTRGGGAGAGERPFVEYDVENGKIITLGHHNGVYTDTKSPESDNLRMLTTNVLNYLGENSTFFAVDPNGKLATAWGTIKSALK